MTDAMINIMLGTIPIFMGLSAVIAIGYLIINVLEIGGGRRLRKRLPNMLMQMIPGIIGLGIVLTVGFAVLDSVTDVFSGQQYNVSSSWDSHDFEVEPAKEPEPKPTVQPVVEDVLQINDTITGEAISDDDLLSDSDLLTDTIGSGI